MNLTRLNIFAYSRTLITLHCSHSYIIRLVISRHVPVNYNWLPTDPDHAWGHRRTITKNPVYPMVNAPHISSWNSQCNLSFNNASQLQQYTSRDRLYETSRPLNICVILSKWSKIAKFIWPTWGPSGCCRPQVGHMLAPWNLLSGMANESLWIVYPETGIDPT